MADNSSNRGFAAMDEDKQKAIASKGGKASGGNRSSSSTRASGAAGKTEAAKRGGQHSHSGGQNS